ncbi:MAG: LTA synthase family protein, partial [Bacillota bacterium]
DKTIKPVLSRFLILLMGIWADFRIEYGILASIAAFAVPLKLLLFYNLIGVSSNFFLVWLITTILTYLLFASFKNKWIPAVLYMLLSILMFCDLTYSSFFNRYLSVGMMGAAGFLGDITESIKQVLKPWFFLALADAVLILAAMTVRQRKLHKSRSIIVETILPYAADEAAAPSVTAEETTEITTETTIEELLATLPEAETVPERNPSREKKEKAKRFIFDHKKPIAALLILMLLVFNVSGSGLITSLSNQEIYSYHIKDIANAITGKSNIGSDYMYSITDSYQTEKNGPLFGVAKGKNLIVIQMESMQNLVVNKTYNGQEITPNLNQLIKSNTIYFDHYYQQLGSGNTSDAEFATNNSIYGSLASYTYKLYTDNYFKGLPKLLKEQGYETAVYHAHEDRNFWNREEAYKSLGFDKFYGGIGGTENDQYDMTEWMGWGLTDTEFFKQSMPYVEQMTQPFYSFIITLSNHHPYLMLDKYQFIELLPEDEGTIFGNYLNSAAYTDFAIGQLIQQLKDEGIYENSIIALYGDHMGLPKSDEEIFKSVSRFLDKDYDFDTMMNIPLIITVPGAEQSINQIVSVTGGQLDFLPTIAYLMGFESLDTVYLGHNLMTIDSGFVAEQTYMTKGSFFSDDIIYEMSRDGVFEN